MAKASRLCLIRITSPIPGHLISPLFFLYLPATITKAVGLVDSGSLGCVPGASNFRDTFSFLYLSAFTPFHLGLFQ